MRNVVKTTLVMDIECYIDYFLVMFRRVDTGTTRVYEMFDCKRLDTEEIRRIMRTFRVVTFNGNNYDLPMLAYALTGVSCANLKEASDTIIVGQMKGWQFEQHSGVRVPREWDHIDLIEVAFGQGSLKLYGGRLHSQKLQDLPIEPSARIRPAQREELVMYCGNDLQTTIDLWNHLGPQIELRERMSSEYGDDLRSKSDAQIAEAVIRKQASSIIGTPVLDVQCKFLNSATYGEDIEIETTIEQWNNKTFVMHHTARRGDTVLAEGREVRLFAVRDPADPKRIKSIPVPEDIKAACVSCRQGACGVCVTEGAVTELPVM